MNKEFLDSFIKGLGDYDYYGFSNNSFNDLVYSEYTVKTCLKHKFRKYLYIPFIYKENIIYIVTHNDLIVRRP